MMESSSLIILAGGHSSRMGTDKAALLWRDRTFLQHALDKRIILETDDILLSGTMSVPEAHTVPDLVKNIGPIGGIYSCLMAAKNQQAVVLSVDTPQLPATLLLDMLAAFSIDANCMLLQAGGYYEPLISLWRKSALPALNAAIQAQQYSVVRAAEAAGLQSFSYTDNPAYICSCNTPEDYLRLKEN